MSINPIVQAVLTDRVRMCVDAGLCVCTLEEVSAECPCHNVDGIAFNDTERAIAPSIIKQSRNGEVNDVV